MSLLPAGTALRSFLPDLDDLLENPAGYLGAGPIVIGPRRMYGLAALFAVPGVAFLLSYFYGKQDAERLALGVGMLLGSAVWFGWSLWTRGHSLILHPDGVEVKYHDSAIWCPWALFNAEGTPHVPEVDSPFTGLIVPVAPDAVPFIELRRGESVIAHGAEIRTPQFVIADDEVVLPGRYEVAAPEIGELLLLIGWRLGSRLPRGAPPPEAYPAEAAALADPDAAGWITSRATRLQFPPICCVCGAATRDVLHFEARSRGGLVLQLFVPVAGHEVTLAIPVCAACQTALRERRARGGMRGLLVGALLGPLLLLLGVASGIAALGITAVAALVGFALGNTLAYRPPVQLRGYSVLRGTVRLRFRNPDYAASVVDLMRQRRAVR